MRKVRERLTHLAASAGLEAGALSGKTVVEILGQDQVLIENYKAILGYGCYDVLIRVKGGYISIDGTNLELACMTGQRLVIRGDICAVRLRGEQDV